MKFLHEAWITPVWKVAFRGRFFWHRREKLVWIFGISHLLGLYLLGCFNIHNYLGDRPPVRPATQRNFSHRITSRRTLNRPNPHAGFAAVRFLGSPAKNIALLGSCVVLLLATREHKPFKIMSDRCLDRPREKHLICLLRCAQWLCLSFYQEQCSYSCHDWGYANS